MTLMHAGDGGGGFHHCFHCGGVAAGPCARCRRPVCGDCCVLTEGGAHQWAICIACEKKGGRSLGAGWAVVLGWLALPIIALILAIAVLAWAFGP